MPDPISGIGAAVSVGGSLVKGSGASKASKIQSQAAMAGVEEQRAAREELRKLLAPYVAAGTPALQAQMDALGLSGPEKQEMFVSQQEQSPIFQALVQQGEDAILQRASATGGLRGGNVQGALAQFRPSMLNQFLEQQYERLGGMTELGQQSAVGVGTSGMRSASSIADLLGEAGAARAGGAAAKGQMFGNILGGLGGLAFGGAF